MRTIHFFAYVRIADATTRTEYLVNILSFHGHISEQEDPKDFPFVKTNFNGEKDKMFSFKLE